MQDQHSGELLSDRLRFIMLELPHATPEFREDESPVVRKFCYALRNMPSFRRKPEDFDGEIFDLLFDSAELTNFTAEEITKYEFDMRTERDFINQLDCARLDGIDEGLARGKAEGREEGLEEGLLKSARLMLESGLAKEDVIRILKLSEQQAGQI